MQVQIKPFDKTREEFNNGETPIGQDLMSCLIEVVSFS